MKKLLMLLAVLGLTFAVAQTGADTYVFISFGAIDTLDPVQAYDTASGEVIENVYETLYYYADEKVDEYEPRLATDFSFNDAGDQFTFNLREMVTFHNGNSFTCEDVEYSYQRALVTNPGDSGAWILMEPLTGLFSDANSELGEDATDEQYAELFQTIENSVVCLDDFTVQFNLVTPDPTFFSKTLFYAAAITDKEWSIANGAWDGTEATWRDWIAVDLRDFPMQTSMNGTGAYKLVEWIPGQRLVAEANNEYWGGAPSIQNVLLDKVDDQSARILAIQQGDADRIELGERSALTQVSGSPGVTIYNENGELGWSSVAVGAAFMNQNIQNPELIGSGQLDGNGIPADFFTDIDMRRCVSYAFDHQVYIDQVLLGAGNTLTMALPPSYLGYDPNVPIYENDLEKAEESCRAAWDGQVWENGFEFTIAYNSSNLGRQTISEIIKANLEFLNPKFRVETRGIAWPDFLALSRDGALPISVSGWIPDYADPDNYIHTFYHSDGFYANRSGFSDAQIDALDEEARTTFDPATRALLYSQLANRAYELAPMVVYPQSIPYMIVRDEVQGVYRNPMLSGQFLWKDISKN